MSAKGGNRSYDYQMRDSSPQDFALLPPQLSSPSEVTGHLSLPNALCDQMQNHNRHGRQMKQVKKIIPNAVFKELQWR